jgi:geranylgeranyl diphosphate synthase type II
VLVAHAAETELWSDIVPLFGSPTLSELEAGELRAMLDASGARAYAEQLLAQHVERAREILDRTHIPAELRHELEPIIDVVLRRGR